MKHIDVCLTPDLLHLHDVDNRIVVVAERVPGYFLHGHGLCLWRGEYHTGGHR